MRAFILFIFSLFLFGALHAQTTTCNCCTENHAAFDFWVGEWEVTSANGSPAGKNTITKEEDGCLLREDWTSAAGSFTGTSFNYYNQGSRQWEQLWVDNQGQQLKLKGNRTGNQMILASEEFKGNDGELYTNRITWTANDDGTVRQLWELLKNNEVSQVLFDGLYTKVK